MYNLSTSALISEILSYEFCVIFENVLTLNHFLLEV